MKLDDIFPFNYVTGSQSMMMVICVLWKFPQHSTAQIISIAFIDTDPARVLAQAGRRTGRIAKSANRLMVSTWVSH
jgi:hypothetical protein